MPAAAFTSVAPGVDIANMTREHDVDLLLVDAPAGLLEDARVLALLDRAPCDVGVVVGDEDARDGPVIVPWPVTGEQWRRWSVGAWLARSRSASLLLVGAAAGDEGRDASRLLANASIAVERAFGVAAEPLLVDPAPEALVAAAAGRGSRSSGLTDRWRHEGLGRTRTALATQTDVPTILVRRGVRPGGLAPRGSETRVHVDPRGLTELSPPSSGAGGNADRLGCRGRRRGRREGVAEALLDAVQCADSLHDDAAAPAPHDPFEVAAAGRLPVSVEPHGPLGRVENESGQRSAKLILPLPQRFSPSARVQPPGPRSLC